MAGSKDADMEHNLASTAPGEVRAQAFCLVSYTHNSFHSLHDSKRSQSSRIPNLNIKHRASEIVINVHISNHPGPLNTIFLMQHSCSIATNQLEQCWVGNYAYSSAAAGLSVVDLLAANQRHLREAPASAGPDAGRRELPWR